MVEWVEVRGRTVDVAVAAAMQELGITDREAVDIELIQEPEKGFLGMGGRDAIVRVKPRPQARKRRRGRGSERNESSDRRDRPRNVTDQSGNRQPATGQTGNREGGARSGPNSAGARRSQPGRSSSQGQRSSDRAGSGSRNSGGRSREGGNTRDRPQGPRRDGPRPARTAPSTADPVEQAPMVEEFLTGLLDAFGLDGQVAIQIDDEVVVAGIEGEQTEALVGPRGSVMEAIHEITKTVLHRQVTDTARVRIDISGYAERRRQALSIYANQLIDQVLGEGGEIMLEPMSAADRKVIHDAVAARNGVESYSEGEPPRRYVVIATTEENGDSLPETSDSGDLDDNINDAEVVSESTQGPDSESQDELESDLAEDDLGEDQPSSST